MGQGSSDKAWRSWGETDPYYAVLTKPEYRAGQIELHRDAFFEEGRVYVEWLLEMIGRHAERMPFGRALDFGCGVGRLAIPFGRHFGEVVGLDISPAMLREGERNAAAYNLGNIRFLLSDDNLSLVEGPLDLVHTSIVLQHIPVPRGLIYIDRMLSLLGSKGVAALHFTVDRQKGSLRDGLYWAQRSLPLVHNFANLARRRPWREPMMQMNEYPLLQVLRLFEKHGIVDPAVLLDRQYDTLAVRMIGQKR